MSDAAEASVPFWAKCAQCAHCWAAAYYPMEAMAFAEIVKRALCPKCGGRALVAKQDAGRLLDGREHSEVPR